MGRDKDGVQDASLFLTLHNTYYIKINYIDILKARALVLPD